jgi:hypothetical protein
MMRDAAKKATQKSARKVEKALQQETAHTLT